VNEDFLGGGSVLGWGEGEGVIALMRWKWFCGDVLELVLNV
jgi:hypothetical protein